jgi:Fe-S cluster biosynthesis and repair protein YggX
VRQDCILQRAFKAAFRFRSATKPRYPEYRREIPMGCGSGMVGPRVEEENRTGRKVFCLKFQREMPGLDEAPFDNHPLGQRIFENVSKEAWKMWLEQMKMIMNEYRLNLGTAEAQEFLLKQMEDYFFGEGAALPPGYVPPRSKN